MSLRRHSTYPVIMTLKDARSAISSHCEACEANYRGDAHLKAEEHRANATWIAEELANPGASVPQDPFAQDFLDYCNPERTTCAEARKYFSTKPDGGVQERVLLFQTVIDDDTKPGLTTCPDSD